MTSGFKICSKLDCPFSGQKQGISNFSFRKDSQSYRLECKICRQRLHRVYRQNNKEKESKRHKKYAQKNSEKIRKYQHSFYALNKKRILLHNKIWKIRNLFKIKELNKCYKNLNRFKLNAQVRERFKKDPVFKIRKIVSSSIRKSIKSRNFNKNKLSFTSYLGYRVDELKAHLEKLFESWMNWENWGVYNPETWNDNDPNTWTWQIDHIKPQSLFVYKSMADKEFKECWALNNLRPYSAKLNILEGSSKIRHTP